MWPADDAAPAVQQCTESNTVVILIAHTVPVRTERGNLNGKMMERLYEYEPSGQAGGQAGRRAGSNLQICQSIVQLVRMIEKIKKKLEFVIFFS